MLHSTMPLLFVFMASTAWAQPATTGYDIIIADAYNNRVQRCPAASPGSDCTTAAGTGEKASGATQLDYPYDIAIDSSGDYVISDTLNHRIQRCPAASPGSDCITVAGTGGQGSSATQLHLPFGIAIDSSGAYIIADASNHRIQRCPAASPGSDCTTVAGTGGQGSSATQLFAPRGIAIDSSGDYVISDTGNHRIQRCPAASPGSACTTVAGTGGRGSGATQLGFPYGIAIASSGDYVIVDHANHRVQRCPAASPGFACTTVAGGGLGGSGTAQLDRPSGVAIDSSGDYVISDTFNHRIQRCPAASPGSACTTMAGNFRTATGSVGRGSTAKQMAYPRNIAIQTVTANASSHNTNQHQAASASPTHKRSANNVTLAVAPVAGLCFVVMACCAGIKVKHAFIDRPRCSSAEVSKVADFDVEAVSDSITPRQATGTLLGKVSIGESKNNEDTRNSLAKHVQLWAQPPVSDKEKCVVSIARSIDGSKNGGDTVASAANQVDLVAEPKRSNNEGFVVVITPPTDGSKQGEATVISLPNQVDLVAEQ